MMLVATHITECVDEHQYGNLSLDKFSRLLLHSFNIWTLQMNAIKQSPMIDGT